MKQFPKISIVINNYNYARFVGTAIESVLTQTTSPYELIVVDDGSTDESRSVIERYHEKIKPIFKNNGGQASAFNHAFAEASGDWIWFVDADDYLMPDAVQTVISTIEGQPGQHQHISKIHSPLWIVDSDGKRTTELHPSSTLSSGSVIDEVVLNGDYRWPPTTGNIFHKSMMNKCMPIPESEYRLCADFYLCSFAPYTGAIIQTSIPVGCYRIHSGNGFYGVDFDKTKLLRNGEILLRTFDRTSTLVRQYTGNKDYKRPMDRRSLESLVIARRFGGLTLPSHLSGVEIHKYWLRSNEIKTAAPKAQIVGFTFWLLLNFAPKQLAGYFVRKGLRKLKKSRNTAVK